MIATIVKLRNDFGYIGHTFCLRQLEAHTMYAQYDGDWNQHFLLGSIIDHQRSKDAVSLSDQKVVKNGKAHIRRSTAG